MPAIWTDTDGRVERTHYQPNELPDEQLQDAILVDSIPEPNPSPDEKAELYYDNANGLHYQYESFPTRLKLPNNDGEILIDSVNTGDIEAVIDTIEPYL